MSNYAYIHVIVMLSLIICTNIFMYMYNVCSNIFTFMNTSVRTV